MSALGLSTSVSEFSGEVLRVVVLVSWGHDECLKVLVRVSKDQCLRVVMSVLRWPFKHLRVLMQVSKDQCLRVII